MNTNLLLEQLNENTLVVNEIPNVLKLKLLKRNHFSLNMVMLSIIM